MSRVASGARRHASALLAVSVLVVVLPFAACGGGPQLLRNGAKYSPGAVGGLSFGECVRRELCQRPD